MLSAYKQLYLLRQNVWIMRWNNEFIHTDDVLLIGLKL